MNQEELHKKPNNILKYVIIISLSLCFGFLGGVLANYTFPAKVIYKTTNAENTAVNKDSLSIQQVVATISDSVVAIKVQENTTGFLGQTITGEGAGSGVIISKDGYIVTNNHVIENASEILVTLHNSKEYTANLIGTDVKTDLAVLKIEETNLTFAPLGDSSKILVGDTAIVIGNPLGEFGGTVTSGIISALDREIVIDHQAMNLLQTNAEVNPGNSGGGLFNSKAELVGIVNAKTLARNVEGIGFAIPSNDVKPIIEQIIDKGYVSKRATLGIYTNEISKDLKTTELYVSKVITGSGADKAGILVDDKIVKVNDEEINSYTQLSKILKKHQPNDTITVTVERDSNLLELNVTLTEVIKE